GRIIEILGERRAEIVKMERKGTFQRIEFTVPSRGLIGVRNRVLNASAGEATMHHVFERYGPYRGPIQERSAGVLVSMCGGKATFYSIDSLRDRRTVFVLPPPDAYQGIIADQHCTGSSLVLNPTREPKI